MYHLFCNLGNFSVVPNGAEWREVYVKSYINHHLSHYLVWLLLRFCGREVYVALGIKEGIFWLFLRGYYGVCCIYQLFFVILWGEMECGF